MTTMQERFDAFHDANPDIINFFLQYTNDLRAAGITRIRADEVLHRVRWSILLIGGDCDLARRLKTLYGNRYAMELMTSGAVPRDFFDLTVAYDN